MTRLQQYGVAAIVIPTPAFLIAWVISTGFGIIPALAGSTSTKDPLLNVLSGLSDLFGFFGFVWLVAIPIGIIGGIMLLIIGRETKGQRTDAPKH